MLTSGARRALGAAGRGPRLRARILAAARRLCFTHGPEGVSARKIAAQVGCSPTAIYLHFRSIGDLLEHLRMEGHALLAAALRAAAPGPPAGARILAMGRAYYRFGLDHPAYYALMFSVRAAETPRREAVQREMYTLMLLRDVVAAGIGRGELRGDLDPMVATNALWAQVHGATALAVSGLLMETAPGHHEEVLEAVLASAVARLQPA